jgi:hypothetical protein
VIGRLGNSAAEAPGWTATAAATIAIRRNVAIAVPSVLVGRRATASVMLLI